MKQKSARQINREAIRDELVALGYTTPMIMLTKNMFYRIVVVLINHLGTILNRHPYRVYMAALCRAERTQRGRPFTPYKQARPDNSVDLRGECLRCPGCGADLLSFGALTHEELTRNIRLRREDDKVNPPKNSPQYNNSR